VSEPNHHVKTLLAGLRRAERTVPLCMAGDLLARLQDLQRQLDEATQERKANASLASGSRTREIADEIEAVRVEMAAHTIVFRLRALRGAAFRDLQLAHPPREDVARDVRAGFNELTFADALIRACVVDPVLDAEDWAQLDELSDAQWQVLAGAAYAVNAADVDIPFSRSAWQVLAESDAT